LTKFQYLTVFCPIAPRDSVPVWFQKRTRPCPPLPACISSLGFYRVCVSNFLDPNENFNRTLTRRRQKNSGNTSLIKRDLTDTIEIFVPLLAAVRFATVLTYVCSQYRFVLIFGIEHRLNVLHNFRRHGMSISSMCGFEFYECCS
jgi:hypothetical protein